MHPLSNPSPLLTAALALSLLGGCSVATKTAESPSPLPTPASSPVAPSPVASATPNPPGPAQLLAEATDYANQAASLAQSAQSRDDWTLVTNRWEQAIALLNQVPEGALEAAKAQENLATYRRSLAQAQQEAGRPINREPVHLSRSDAATAETAAPDATASPAAEDDSPAPEADTEADTNVSAEVALATHLRQSGARMYATYWCGYCRRQQELFGPEAAQQLEIIECDPRGSNPQVDRCQAANVGSFPTWEINGQLYPGMQPLTTLANMSGYTGPRTFRN